MLKFEITNNFHELFIKKNNNTGIGLNNVKQRLKLLYAKNEYNLSINTNDNIFHVTLELKLK
jgi:sensor histidine kinase YesM